MNAPIFTPFPKTPRLFREVIVTEKIDGTNATIAIFESPDGSFPDNCICGWSKDGSSYFYMMAGSRTRWITPDKDNHGFATWVSDNDSELMKLGVGIHRGEWWGSGIQRGYGLQKGEKRLSLFNTVRWCLHGTDPQVIPSADPTVVKMQDVLPECVGLVPVLYQGPFCTVEIQRCLNVLRSHGSWANPRYLNPEGIVVFHTAANEGFKVTLENDGQPKSLKP